MKTCRCPECGERMLEIGYCEYECQDCGYVVNHIHMVDAFDY